ncbi:unnamed protein product [Ceratitis capitata]|uniref:(Mediterranean fruit fly) hypothetical protein n=1 Tax=Ceratitis capitata TaxID=7213 RepID=A0A811VD33_CERCA|nr:unnamed protein product [Ceratitis capitata]
MLGIYARENLFILFLFPTFQLWNFYLLLQRLNRQTLVYYALLVCVCVCLKLSVAAWSTYHLLFTASLVLEFMLLYHAVLVVAAVVFQLVVMQLKSTTLLEVHQCCHQQY